MRFTMPATTMAIPAYTRPASGPRILTQKRFSRIRVNWFVLGAIFGVGASFFMNLLVGTVILPRYEEWVAAPAAKPVQLARITPVVATTATAPAGDCSASSAP